MYKYGSLNKYSYSSSQLLKNKLYFLELDTGGIRIRDMVSSYLQISSNPRLLLYFDKN
jgi:hypothetical protein